MFIHGNHEARGGNGSSWWGCVCDVYFASKKTSKRKFFVPAGVHLAVSCISISLDIMSNPGRHDVMSNPRHDVYHFST